MTTTSPWPDEPLNDPLDDLDYLRSQRLIPAYGAYVEEPLTFSEGE